nr:cytochrome c3 family protein [Rhodoferax sp.]
MMNKSLLKGVMTRGVGSVAILLLTMGVFGSQQALAAIAGGKHDLTPTGSATNKFTATAAGATEICVFCHTPHGSASTAELPLWNRTASAGAYTTYNTLGTSSLDGATAAVGSVSLACLSCHDGATAMNTMVNAPGSGLGGGAYSGTWSAGTGTMAAGIANLGKDLKNDHPIGIQYGGGMAGNVAYTQAAIGDGGFKDTDFKGVQFATLNSQPLWWVDTGGAGRQKTDLMLYTRTGASATPAGTSTAAITLAGAQAFVECASCHDPHSTNTTFLRISNAGSAVCLACHIK